MQALALAVMLLAGEPMAAPSPTPMAFTMQLVPVRDTKPPSWVFVVGAQGFKTVAGLEDFLESFPGASLTWDPGCRREGGEPLLSDEKALEVFKSWCAAHKITFVLKPSG